MKVDKEIKKVYLDLFKKMLLTPEKWEGLIFSFCSPYINKETKIRFKIENYTSDYEVFIQKNGSNIYKLNISWWDFKTKGLISDMYYEKWKEEKMKEEEKLNTDLKNGLGSNMDRFLKLTKIRRKL